MPNTSIKQLGKQVSSLPTEAKKIFLKAYNTAYAQTNNEESSFEIALAVVKKKYTKEKNKWILKSSVSVNSDVKRSGIFLPNLTFTAVVSSINKDYEGNSVSDILLRNLSNSNLVENHGDFDHLLFDGFSNYKGAFKKLNHWYDNGKLYLKFLIDKSYDKFNDVKELFKDKKIAEVSAEFYNPVVVNNKIVNASRLGWSVCRNDSAINPDAKIIKTEKRE